MTISFFEMRTGIPFFQSRVSRREQETENDFKIIFENENSCHAVCTCEDLVTEKLEETLEICDRKAVLHLLYVT